MGDAYPKGRQPLADATLVAFDCEMTGTDPRRHGIVSLGAVRIRQLRVTDETFSTIVHPGRRIPREATVVHGLSDADVWGHPPLDAVLPQFRAFVGDAIPVGHVAELDLSFLAPALRSNALPSLERVLDTAVLAATLMPARRDVTLDGLCSYFRIPPRGRHTAFGDALLTAQVFLRLVPYLEHRAADTLERALHWGDAHHAHALR